MQPTKLFGTYQPLYSDDDLKRGRQFRQWRDWSAMTGFAHPIWAFACDTPADAIVGSYLAAPRFPEILLMFESNQYVRIDKKKWYLAIGRGEDGTVSLDDIRADDSLPDALCEFIVDRQVYDDTRLAFADEASQHNVMLNIVTLDECLEGGQKACICSFAMTDEQAAYLTASLSTYLDVHAYRESHLDTTMAVQTSLDEQRKAWKVRNFSRAWSVDVTILPTLVRIIKGIEPFHDIMVQGYTLHYNYLVQQYMRFCRWQERPVDDDTLVDVVSSMQAVLIENPDVVAWLVSSGSVGRNDPCPCGSGKKFKKCHGRFGEPLVLWD